ncbi:MAG: DUF1499 domain-containing protein [Pirellulaceae bacterium]
MENLKKLKRRALVIFSVSTCLAWLGIRWGNKHTRPSHLFRTDQLQGCPNSPNCVSTSSAHPSSRIEPIPFEGTVTEARQKLELIIRNMPGSRIVHTDERYIHAEYRSRVLGFIDDLEVLIDEGQQQIFLRSASRIGYSDFGANRKRTEELRRLYAEL